MGVSLASKPGLTMQRFAVTLAVVQVVLLVLFVIFVHFGDDVVLRGSAACSVLSTEESCSNHTISDSCVWNSEISLCEVTAEASRVTTIYPYYQDVHAMIFIGFGFLMTFLARYGFSALGLNMLLAALAIQWGTLTNGFWHRVIDNDFSHQLTFSIEELVTGDFAAGAVLITFGALLGRTSPLQMIAIVGLELIFYSLSEAIGVLEHQAVDMGGSIYVHTFGAYFGLACSLVLGMTRRRNNGHVSTKFNGSDRTSDRFAMVGAIVLWIFWPSFNGALAVGASQHRVVINTVLALSASCVMAFAASAYLRPHHKLSMVDIQNATLAGQLSFVEKWMRDKRGEGGVGFVCVCVCVCVFFVCSSCSLFPSPFLPSSLSSFP